MKRRVDDFFFFYVVQAARCGLMLLNAEGGILPV